MNKLLLALALSLAPAAHAASFLISVDTTSLDTTAGIVFFDFSTLNAQSSSAAVTAFIGAPLGSALAPIGAVTGGLPTNDLVLTSAAPPNGANYGINVTFTTSFAFVLNLYGPAVDTPDNGADGTTFSIQLSDGSFNPLLTVDGIVGLLNIAGDGTITTDGLGISNFTEAVPEPSTFLTLAAGVASLAIMRRRRA